MMEYLNGNLTAEEVRKSDLYKRGDCINIWVNEGEFQFMQMELASLRQQLTKPADDTITLPIAEVERTVKEIASNVRYAMLCPVSGISKPEEIEEFILSFVKKDASLSGTDTEERKEK
jgi:hypothetical protein